MFCDYLKARKTQLKLTAQELANLSGVSLATVNNILCGRTPAPGIDTAAALIQAVSGSLDEACDLTAPPPKPAPTACDSCKLIKLYRERIKQKDRYVIVLFAVCSFFALVMLAILLYDLFNHNTGYIRR